jgi:hypothetical protein
MRGDLLIRLGLGSGSFPPAERLKGKSSSPERECFHIRTSIPIAKLNRFDGLSLNERERVSNKAARARFGSILRFVGHTAQI